ncbi:hypothetical protein C2E25_14180 [Geothermobacter hydrogeniphilus]|uniref:HTH cro/C1-type domain-containing protein n=1 Tax=Geothermobacter hydrogeniphilus TaxID=1969733 RepID=A0A2K2H7B1_9BACT|nr:hypothetical protein C2E25_14180 [Geothermobacter hydrogeniphilus]
MKIPRPLELETEPKTLGEQLRRRRIEQGLQQKEVAARLGVTTSTVWNWEHGWRIGGRYGPRIVGWLAGDSAKAAEMEMPGDGAMCSTK